MNIRNTILGLLMYGPQTGYDLKQAFDSSLGFFAGASFGSIYPILRRCRQDGLVKMEQEIQDGKPNRKIYSLTDQGREQFLRAAGETLAMSPYRNEFLVRLFFFDFIDPSRRAGVLDEYMAYLADTTAALKELKARVDERADSFQAACYAFGLRYVEDLEKNVKQLRKELADAGFKNDKPCCLFPSSRRGEAATGTTVAKKGAR